MASSRRTYDTDSITLRTIFAKNQDNTNVSALKVLTADGAGRCYWGDVSGAAGYSAFNEIITSAGTYTADLSYNRFRLYAATGIGMTNGATGSNQTTLYAKCFTNIDCSGDNNIYAFSNNVLHPSVKLAGQGGILITSDPATNTIFLTGPANSNYSISTGIYAFNKIFVVPTTSSITADISGVLGDYITATNPSTLLRLLGNNDIQLSTNTTTNSVFFTISTFTSQGYLDISGAAFSAYPIITSTVSTLYAQRSDLANLSISTSKAVQLNINSTTIGLGTTGYVSSQSLVSTVRGLGTAGYVSTSYLNSAFSSFSTAIGPTHISYLYSSLTGLGSLGYVSSLSLVSTVKGLGTSGYASTSYVNSGLSSFSTAIGPTSILNLYSTVVGLGTAGYVSTQTLESTITNFKKYNFVSSIPFINTSQIISPIIDPSDTTFSLGFSTYQFSLSTFSSYINSNTSILIEQRPNIIYSGVSSFNSNFGLQRFFNTTGLYTNDFTTSFTESTANPFLPFSINPEQSNFFTNSLLMPLTASNVLSNITSTFQTFTIVANSILYDNGVTSNTPGLLQSSLNIYYPTNSLFLHINNS